jgi:hypothetical protein
VLFEAVTHPWPVNEVTPVLVIVGAVPPDEDIPVPAPTDVTHVVHPTAPVEVFNVIGAVPENSP